LKRRNSAMQGLRKPSQSLFMPSNQPLNLETQKPDREIDRIVFN